MPIILTQFPRNANELTHVQLGPWHWLRNTLLGLRSSANVVIDATSLLARQENGFFDGTYITAMSDDHMHPNNKGHEAIGRAIAGAIRLYL